MSAPRPAHVLECTPPGNKDPHTFRHPEGTAAPHEGHPHASGGRLNRLHSVDNGDDTAWRAEVTDSPAIRAFSRKSAIHPGMMGIPMSAKDAAEKLEELRATPRSGPGAAYVHFPYCEGKCVYCGFFGGQYSPEAGNTYLKALLREIESGKDAPCVGQTPINALYIGGGTPTALAANELRTLLQTLRACLPLANDCEITVEGRIHNFGPEKMEACLEGGANRFSFGVQSFQTEIRRSIGRKASAAEVKEALQRLASYNQAAVVIDLIYGLPGQSVGHWEDDIKQWLDLPLDGVDLYQLNIFPGNALDKALASGKLPPVAALREQPEFFFRGLELMRSARMRRLSLSHWAGTTRERNLYNPLAKRRADCLQFGAGAGGMLGGYMMMNRQGADEYLRAMSEAGRPLGMMMAPPPAFGAIQSILEQMEVCALNPAELERAWVACGGGSETLAALLSPLFDNWEEAGLIRREADWVILTDAGEFWQVNLTQALINRLRRAPEGKGSRP